MRRWLVWCLILLLFLAGCAGPEPSESESVPAESEAVQESSESESSEEPLREATLLEGREAADAEGNMWYVPNAEFEEMFIPDVQIYGDKMLAISYSDHTEMNGEVLLKLFDLYDGSLMGEIQLLCSGFISIQMNEHQVGICDAGQGWVKILDNNLQVRREYQMAEAGASWYLSRDMETLYHFGYDEGIYVIDLATQTRRELVPGAMVGYTRGESFDAVIFEYIDKKSHRYVHGWLDLETKEVKELPFDGDLGWVYRSGDTWMYYTVGNWDHYRVVAEEKYQFESTETFRLLGPQGHLQQVNLDGSGMTLYNQDGTFLADCSFTDGYQSLLYWSDLYQGYFFVNYAGDDGGRLCFWEVVQESGGEDLVKLPFEEDEKTGGQAAAKELYERAEQISETYGVDIRISDQCQLQYSEFWAMPVDDDERITEVLDMLEEVLSAYPEGFFEQLKYGHLDRIQIELVSNLLREGVPEDAAYTEFSAFAQEMSDYYLVVVDVGTSEETTYHHEFSHIIDKRLGWDAQYRPGALFSEEDWQALSPEGFEYAYSYYDVPYELWDENYFIDLYACTFPTEDRARVFEYAMMGLSAWFPEDSGLEAKLEYYCQCIRDCFDTSGWPEVTTWEVILESVAVG